MLKKSICISFLFLGSMSFGQNIKMITEFKNENDSLIKVRSSEFDKSGNLLKEVKFGAFDPISQTFRNHNRTFEYKNGIRVSEYNCEEFVSKDTCVIRSFSTFKYDPKTNVETQTRYEADSLIRFIKEVKREDKIRVSKVYTWEMSPVTVPDYEKAIFLGDTVYYDDKNRIIELISFNNKNENTIKTKYKYSKNKYTSQTIGTPRNRQITYDYTPLQKEAHNLNLEYIFSIGGNYKYEVEYYEQYPIPIK